MATSKNKTVRVQDTEISIIEKDKEDFISLSDMVKNFDGGSALIEQWLRNKDTIEFLGIWERINNPDFNSLEFEGIRNEAGTNRFYLSVKKWVSATNAVGIFAKSGRYGGTYAQKDIAFEFGSWLSPEFKLYLIKEFQRLKEEEQEKLSNEWNLHRTLAKVNYRIHTDAIKEHIIPPKVTKKQQGLIYATEADLLNMAMFGMTAKTWRDQYPDKDGNIRDHSTLEQLLVLANLESLNAEFIRMELPSGERLKKLNATAIRQMKSLASSAPTKQIKSKK
ncbi:MAG: KilA-N domain-containing protein [Cyclobacteriaceae bacterium]